MTAPPWLAAVLAAVMLLIAAASAARLALWRLRGRAAEPEADALHVLMGVAMASMLEPAFNPVPDPAWRIVFASAATWFAWRAIRDRRQKRQDGGRGQEPGSWRCVHPAPHLVESAAMVYMLLPAGAGGDASAPAMPGMPSAAPAANPAVALVLALFMLGYILWTADRLTSHARSRTAPGNRRPTRGAGPDSHHEASIAPTAGAALAPRAAACTTIAMSLGMGYMLLTML